MRAAALVLSAVVGLAGCGQDKSSGDVPDPFTVVVSDDVERVSREGGVDLEGLVAESARRVFELLPHRGRVSIYVALDASRSIPETGVGGFTDPSTGTVSIWIDGTPPGGLKAALEAWVPATLAHELHHSSRVRAGPGYGSTLAEVLVTEGLADHFVLEAFPETPPQPWDNALSQHRESDVWRKAQSVLEDPDGYDHWAWFFGSGDLPRWSGYTLGYRIVAAYLGDERSASSAVDAAASTVIEPYVHRR